MAACAELAADPCNVGYIYSVKAAALDTTLRIAFDEVTSAHPEIVVVQEGESFYTTALGLAASQNMLAAHPDLSLIVAADQAITGAVAAVEADGRTNKPLLIGYGGGAVALQGIAGRQPLRDRHADAGHRRPPRHGAAHPGHAHG